MGIEESRSPVLPNLLAILVFYWASGNEMASTTKIKEQSLLNSALVLMDSTQLHGFRL